MEPCLLHPIGVMVRRDRMHLRGLEKLGPGIVCMNEHPDHASLLLHLAMASKAHIPRLGSERSRERSNNMERNQTEFRSTRCKR